MHYYNIYVMLAFIVILAVAGAVAAPKKAALLLKTARWSRHIYYSAITATGFFIGVQQAPLPPEKYWLYFGACIMLINLLFAASMILNNIFDTKIDAINNKENTMNHTAITKKQYILLYFALIVLSLGLAALVSLYAAAAALVIHFTAYLYSCPPARIKKIFPFNTLLIAFSTLLALFLGFIIPAGPKVFALFPWKFSVMLFFTVILIFNTGDVNDFEGDKKYDVRTLMTLLGYKKGKLLAASLTLSGYLLIALLADMALLTAASLICGLSAFFVVCLPKKHINEPLLFVIFYIYAAVFIFLKPGLF